ncbi:MAG: HEPN domain-containing protein [Magnetospirillum sp. WYHS-4]
MSPEIANRLAKARRFLDEAERADPATSPLSIVHDCYYAMFHMALAVLAERTGSIPVRHGSVIGGFGRLVKDMGEEAKRHGRSFNDLQELRLVSDYAPESTPTEDDAFQARQAAQAFLVFCSGLLDGGK